EAAQQRGQHETRLLAQGATAIAPQGRPQQVRVTLPKTVASPNPAPANRPPVHPIIPDHGTPRTEPAPRAEPRPQPRTEPQPRPQPRVEPQPRPEPRPQPRVEPQPRPEPRPQPRVEPRPEPRPQPRI